MPQRKKKPDYDAKKILQEMLDAVSEAYLDKNSDGYLSITATGREFDITLLKARKLLITSGAFSSETSNQVNRLFKSGKSISEIQQIMKLSRASVYSYLPYSRVIYNAREVSVNADRIKRYRARQSAVDRLLKVMKAGENQKQPEQALWEALQQFEFYPFQTLTREAFTYRIKDCELIVTTGKKSIPQQYVEEKSITRGYVDIVFEKVLERKGHVAGIEDLEAGNRELDSKHQGTHEIEYLFPIFQRLGMIEK